MVEFKKYFVGYKGALLVYILLFFTCTSPFWVLDEVVSPYSQCIEFGFPEPCRDETRIEHRGLTDHPNFYIPEVYQHLNGARSGWLGLWTKQTELGRPLSQLAGFSSAYLPSWVLAQFTDNPWRFITIYSLLSCFFAGLFVMLFCREMNLHPLAGLVAGSTLAVSPTLMFWLIFPMYISVWCWAAGALWAITRISKRYDLLGWSVLAFSIHSLGVTAYQQLVVHHGYLLFGWGAYLGYRTQQNFGWQGLGKFLGCTATAVVVGVVATAPVLLDLAFTASESKHGLNDASFYTIYLQGMGHLIDALRFFIFITLPELFGKFKFADYGFSITLLTIYFLLVGLFADSKRVFGWWIFVIIFIILTFSYTLYGFGVRYLGFNLSPVLPISNISLPLAILVGFGADKLFDDAKTESASRIKVVTAAFIGTLIVAVLALAYGYYHDLKMHWEVIVSIFIVLSLLATQIDKTRPVFVLLAFAVVTATTTFPVMFRQSSASILSSSPLIEAIRNELADGGRYVIANPELPVLPPNLNASLGLESVYSSNSMASRRYHTWIEAMNEGKTWGGGRDSSATPDYGGAMFWMSNISVVLASAKQVHDNLVFSRKEGEFYLYKVRSRMGASRQVTVPDYLKVKGDDLNVGDVRLLPKYSTLETLDKGDMLEFNVTAGESSVFILSQKYHKDWQAQVQNGAGWQLAKTIVINGVFQGVLLPPNTQKVHLEFKPYVRLSWIAHLFWVFLLAVLGVRAWKYRRSSHTENIK